MKNNKYLVECPFCLKMHVPPKKIKRDLEIIGLGYGDYVVICKNCLTKDIGSLSRRKEWKTK